MIFLHIAYDAEDFGAAFAAHLNQRGHIVSGHDPFYAASACIALLPDVALKNARSESIGIIRGPSYGGLRDLVKHISERAEAGDRPLDRVIVFAEEGRALTERDAADVFHNIPVTWVDVTTTRSLLRAMDAGVVDGSERFAKIFGEVVPA